MNFSELSIKPKADLDKMLLEYRGKLRQFRFDLVAGKVKNVREIRVIKKLIAQIKTICQKSNS